MQTWKKMSQKLKPKHFKKYIVLLLIVSCRYFNKAFQLSSRIFSHYFLNSEFQYKIPLNFIIFFWVCPNESVFKLESQISFFQFIYHFVPLKTIIAIMETSLKNYTMYEKAFKLFNSPISSNYISLIAVTSLIPHR